jgi:hypothetical protein
MNVLDDRFKLNRFAIPLLLAALVIAWALYSYTANALNGSWIVYRYAEQFRAGNGLVFNAGERVLLVPAPLYMFALGLAAQLFPASGISTLATAIFGISLGISALALYWIARHARLSDELSIVTSVLFVLAWPFWLGMGTANATAAMFCFVALVLARTTHWQAAGVVLTCGILTAPESALLGIPLLFMAANHRKGIRFFAATVLPLLAAVLLLRIYYGPSLWDGLLLLKNNDPDSLQTTWLALVALPILLLAGWGWFKNRAHSIAAVLGAWATLYLLVIGVLLHGEGRTSYLFISGAIPVLLFLGLKHLRFKWRWATPLSGLVVSAAILAITYFEVVSAMPLNSGRENNMGELSSGQSIGISSATQLAELDASASQSIISFDGQLQPELKAMIERGDIQSALIRYVPDAIVTGNAGRLRVRDLNSPAVARLGYHVGDLSHVYIRGAAIGSFGDIPATANFGPDIKLSGAALDQTSLKPGQLLRVRLDWQFARPASRDVTVDLWLVSGQGDQYILAHASDTYVPSIFRAGPYSTYHALTVVESAWSGPVTLQAAIVINNGVAARVPIATLNINATPRERGRES